MIITTLNYADCISTNTTNLLSRFGSTSPDTQALLLGMMPVSQDCTELTAVLHAGPGPSMQPNQPEAGESIDQTTARMIGLRRIR